jgi:hypothetical protein
VTKRGVGGFQKRLALGGQPKGGLPQLSYQYFEIFAIFPLSIFDP